MPGDQLVLVFIRCFATGSPATCRALWGRLRRDPCPGLQGHEEAGLSTDETVGFQQAGPLCNRTLGGSLGLDQFLPLGGRAWGEQGIVPTLKPRGDRNPAQCAIAAILAQDRTGEAAVRSAGAEAAGTSHATGRVDKPVQAY